MNHAKMFEASRLASVLQRLTTAHEKSPRKTRVPGGEDGAYSGSDWMARRYDASCVEPLSNEIRPRGISSRAASVHADGERRGPQKSDVKHPIPSAGLNHVLARVRREVMRFARQGQERFFAFSSSDSPNFLTTLCGGR